MIGGGHSTERRSGASTRFPPPRSGSRMPQKDAEGGRQRGAYNPGLSEGGAARVVRGPRTSRHRQRPPAAEAEPWGRSLSVGRRLFAVQTQPPPSGPRRCGGGWAIRGVSGGLAAVFAPSCCAVSVP